MCLCIILDTRLEWWVEILCGGAVVLGFVGLWLIRELIWRRKMVFLVTLMQSNRILRIFALLGLFHAFKGLLQEVMVYVRFFLFRFGEKILEVSEST